MASNVDDLEADVAWFDHAPGALAPLAPAASRAGQPEPPVWSFGPFVLDTVGRTLQEAGAPVRLGSRAFDLLLVLLRHAGDLVPRQALMAAAWPGEVVEDNTLRVQLSALRKALGDGQRGRHFIKNIPGRGYVFVGEPGRGRPSAGPAARLPAGVSRSLGPDDSLRSVCEGLGQARVVTLLGPGGIGKTTVAIAAARAQALSRADGAVFVELAPLPPGAASEAVVATVCVALAIGPAPAHDADDAHDADEARLIAHLAPRALLLVVDNCEHVIDTLAPLLERVLLAAPRVQVLATSREALRIAGERVHRLSALAYPVPTGRLAAADAIGYPAVALLVERIAALDETFVLTDDNATAVAAICRTLDGSPLALELVATMVRTLGLADLVDSLEQRILGWPNQRRATSPRHHTLGSAIAWSWQLLSPREQRVLGRLTTFRTAMDFADAVAVAADDEADRAATHDTLCELVAKCWLIPVAGREPVRLRMERVPRAFARARWEPLGEVAAVRARHAQRVVARVAAARLAAAGDDPATGPAPQAVDCAEVAAAAAFLADDAETVDLAADLLAEAARTVADPALHVEVDRLLAQASHGTGALAPFRRFVDRVLASPVRRGPWGNAIGATGLLADG